MPGYEICFDSNHSVSLFDSIGTSLISLEDIELLRKLAIPRPSIYFQFSANLHKCIFFQQLAYVFQER